MKYFRNPIIFISTILVLITLITISYFYSSKKQDTHSDEKIAYIKKSGSAMGGDIWIMNMDKFNQEKLTTKLKFGKIYSWSPSKEYIAVEEIKTNENQVEMSLGVVNIQTGEYHKLAESKSSLYFDFVTWIKNDKGEVQLVRSTDTTVEYFSIDQKNKVKIINPPFFADNLTSDNTHIIGYSGDKTGHGLENFKLNTFDVKSNHSKPIPKLEEIILDTAFFIGFIDKQAIFYSIDGIFSYDLNTKETVKIIDQDFDSIYGDGWHGHAISPDKSLLVYMASIDGVKQIFVYDFSTDPTPILNFSKFVDEKRYQYKQTITPTNIEVSNDNSMIYFDTDGEIYQLTIKNGKIKLICDSDCHSFRSNNYSYN